jgi:hypothetical protein
MTKDRSDVYTLRPADDWWEEDGPVIWWHLPVCEPPEIGYGPGAGEMTRYGEPTDCAAGIESGWLTHWSYLPQPERMIVDGPAVDVV